MVQWEESLRIYPWFPTPGVSSKPPWNEGEGGTPTKKVKDFECDRIGRADRDNSKFEYFKDRWAHLKKGEADWGAWEKFCFKMVACLAEMEPHYPDFSGPTGQGPGLLVSRLLFLQSYLSFDQFP